MMVIQTKYGININGNGTGAVCFSFLDIAVLYTILVAEQIKLSPGPP